MKTFLFHLGVAATLVTPLARALAVDFGAGAAADLLIGKGYVSVPLGQALRQQGNGRFTLADRNSALYAGGQISLELTDVGKAERDYFIDASLIQGSSEGTFRDTSAYGSFLNTPTSNQYRLSETFQNAYLRTRIARDPGDSAVPTWQIQARLGMNYVEGKLEGSLGLANSVVRSTQKTQDLLGNIGLEVDFSLRKLLPEGIRERTKDFKVVVDGEVFAGARDTYFTEELSRADSLGGTTPPRDIDVASFVYGGIGRATLRYVMTLSDRDTSTWYLTADLGLQSRYLLNEWDSLRDRDSGPDQPRLNVRADELLWGPYFRLGILCRW